VRDRFVRQLLRHQVFHLPVFPGHVMAHLKAKHYEALAAIFRRHLEIDSERAHTVRMCQSFADYFAVENEKFDRARFLHLAGLEESCAKRS
jgi:hypothetical protein